LKILYLAVFYLSILQFSVAQDKSIIAIVNDIDTVFIRNVQLRQKINALQSGMDSSFSSALYQLVYSSCLVEISKNYTIEVNDSILLNESERIDKNTHNPKLLNEIKVLCKSYPTYAKIYLRPDFIIRWFNYNYNWNFEIHKQKGDSAKVIISEIIKNLNSLIEVSKKYKLSRNKYSISKKNGLVLIPENKDIIIENNINSNITKQGVYDNENYINSINQKTKSTTDDIINSVLNKLKIGELYPLPIEFENCFWILRLIDIKSDEYFAEVLEINKNNSDEWIKNEVKKIQIKVFESVLWDEMVKDLPIIKNNFQFSYK